MTDKLREAIKWAREQAACDSFTTSPPDARVRADMLRLLASDVESRLPRTKMVEVWRVEFTQYHLGKWTPLIATYETQTEAEKIAEAWRNSLGHCCIRVTGPHTQEVPA